MSRRFRIYDGTPLGDDGKPSRETQELIDRIVKQLNQDVDALYKGLDCSIPWGDAADDQEGDG